MFKFKISLKTVNDIKDFANIAMNQDFDIDVTDGRNVIDGKSILGLFSLNIMRELECSIYTDKEQYSKFLCLISKYIL